MWFGLLIIAWYLLNWSFVAVMHAKFVMNEGESKLTLYWKVMLAPLAVIGIVLDIAFNIVVGTILFRELPQELMFTSRCRRHIDDDGRDGRIARWWQKQLNIFDKGHI